MLSELALSAVTDVVLACELFFLAGLMFRPGIAAMTPAWTWGVTLAVIGLASMLGAIDHGFFEPVDHPAHRPLVVATRIVIVAGSLLMIVAASAQYLRGVLRTGAIAVGAVLALWPVTIILTSDGFLPVILYYSGGLVFLLVLSVIHFRQNTGTPAMILGIGLSLGVSGMIPAGSNGFAGLGLYGSYHVLLMPVVLLLYLGGRAFRGTAV